MGNSKKSTNEVNRNLDELLSISYHHIDISNDINKLAENINNITMELREKAQLLANDVESH